MKSVEAELLFAKLAGAKNVVNIVVLDACRNNPFGRSIRSATSGLAQVTAPSGSIVAFSTAPGQIAEDGSGSNSIYSAALAKYLKEPGLRVEDVFKKVRAEVSSLTKGAQTPWENTSLTGDFVFIEGDATVLKKAALRAAGDAKKGELDVLLKMEADATKQKEKEQAELRKKELELTKLDAQIAEMKSRLGSGAATSDDSLDAVVAMIEKKEQQAQKLENLRLQRVAEEKKRQKDIERLKIEATEKRRGKVWDDLSKYKKVAESQYGQDMKSVAWDALLASYPESKSVTKYDTDSFLVAVGLNSPVTKDPTIGMEFVSVLGGCFQRDERELCVNNFSIGKFEVTQGQWQSIMGNNPSHFSRCGDNCPVEHVSWNDVLVFINKLNRLSNKNYRLPTKAEWEYACRSGGKSEDYCGGNNVRAVAWYGKEISGEKTHPVGTKQPNGLGIYDMNGNVEEWVNDPSLKSEGMFGGGSWYTGLSFATWSDYFKKRHTGYSDFDLGFRLAYN